MRAREREGEREREKATTEKRQSTQKEWFAPGSSERSGNHK